MPKLAVLYEAGQAVLSTFDLDEVLQRILAIARDYFHLRNVAISSGLSRRHHRCFGSKATPRLCSRRDQRLALHLLRAINQLRAGDSAHGWR
jgi:hypothetical protein